MDNAIGSIRWLLALLLTGPFVYGSGLLAAFACVLVKHPALTLGTFIAIYFAMLVLIERLRIFKDPISNHAVCFALTCLLCSILWILFHPQFITHPWGTGPIRM
jgi:hypothetical protein